MKKPLFIGIAIGLIIASIIGFIIWPRNHPEETATSSEIIRETFIDTIPYYEPTPRDSLIVRYETKKLKTADTDSLQSTGEAFMPDSISVEIPITQKMYADSTYQVWVSGYSPTLDSLRVFPKREVITITNTLTQKEKQKRWGLSVGAGMTMNTRKEIQPGIFIGVSYTFFAF